MAPVRVLFFLAVLLAAPLAPSAAAQSGGEGEPVCFQVDGQDLPDLHRDTPSGRACMDEDGLVVNMTFGDRNVTLEVGFKPSAMVVRSDSPVPTSSLSFDPQLLNDSVRVVLRVHASWRDGCANARGNATLYSDDKPWMSFPSVALGPLCAPDKPTTRDVLDAIDRAAAELSAVAPTVAASLKDLLDDLPPLPETERPETDAPDVDAPETPDATVETTPEQESEAGDAAAADALADVTVNLTEPGVDPKVEGDVDGPGVRTALRVQDAGAPEARQTIALAPAEPAFPEAASELPADEPRRAPVTDASRPAAPPPAPAPDVTRAGTPAPGITPQGVLVQVPPDGPDPRVAVATAAGATFLLAVAWALYQRIARAKALEHPSRARLHELLRAAAAPLGVADLARQAELTPKSALYHLRYLARCGLLKEERSPEGSKFAIPGTPPAPPVEPLGARVRAALRSRPGLSTRELAETVGVKYGRMDRVLKELLCTGAVESRVEEGRRAYFAMEPRTGEPGSGKP